ncbi:MAG: hypothetical protein C0516_13425 [Gemmatimonas sp.]|uniref:hypothetical protein n=1 Tax=Gemmatimonas sp. UBA7669 TaxID=1946568 RepID=UPI0025BFBF87|nr:hypothetical protein [Gemmatimonas sp. UBA7669]MBA3919574.1 hypothetical protein [Gemmatimonas sp.]
MYQETSGAAATPSVSNVISMVQLQNLQQRREIIAEQYQNTIAERGRIGQERLNAQARGDMDMVKEYDATIARIGTRLQTLERRLADADRQIDEAMQTPIAIEGEPASTTDPVVASNPGTAIAVIPPTGSQVDGMLRAQANEYQRAMAIEAVGLLLLGAVLWRFGVARGRRKAREEALALPQAARNDDRLQQAVDAIAIEVERLSEGQRFINNLMATRRPEREALPSLPGTTPNDGTRITPH